jgi:hypothetical protein
MVRTLLKTITTPKCLSIFLTLGLIFQGLHSLADNSPIESEFLKIYQKFIGFQDKVESVTLKPTVEGELPLLNVEKIELEELKTELTQEVISLQTKLNQLQKQIGEVDEELKRYSVPQSLTLTNVEIENLMQGQIADCQIAKMENPKAYKITNSNGESIRFAFNEITKENEAAETAPTASLISIESQNDAIRIKQPAFQSKQLDVKTEMSATIDYIIKNDSIQFVFVTFLGQAVEDKIFSRSSYKPFRVICKSTIRNL